MKTNFKKVFKMDDKTAKKLVLERKKLRAEFQSLTKKLWKTNLCSSQADRYRDRMKEIDAIFEEKGSLFQYAFAYLLTPQIEVKKGDLQ